MEGTSQELYCGIVVGYVSMGLNLPKESVICVPQPKDFCIHFCSFYFNCNLLYLWYIAPTFLLVTEISLNMIIVCIVCLDSNL